MKGSIVYKFSQEEVYSLVILLKIAENLKIIFKRLVLSLSLTISLEVKSYTKLLFSYKILIESTLELASKKGSLIRDNTIRKAKGLEDILE